MPNFRLILLFLLFTTTSHSNGWRISGLEIQSEDSGFVFFIQEAQVDAINLSLWNITYKCLVNSELYPTHECSKGLLTFDNDGEVFEFKISTKLDFKNADYDFVVSNKAETFSLEWNNSAPDMFSVKLDELAFAEIPKKLLPENLTGVISSNIIVDLSNKARIRGHYSFTELNYESDDGSIVFADVNSKGEFDFQQNSNQESELMISSRIDNGESLLKDLYLDFQNAPIGLNSKLMLSNDLEIKELKVNSDLGDQNSIEFWSPNSLDLEKYFIQYKLVNLEKFHQVYLNSLLELYGFNNTTLTGSGEGQVTLNKNQLSEFVSNFEDTNFIAPEKKVEFNNLNGNISWSQTENKASKISWDSAIVAGMPVKQFETSFSTFFDKLYLPKQVAFPVFDGEIQINDFVMTNMFSESVSASFSGNILPISIEEITKKLNWPIMSGSLSGNIPGVIKKGGSLIFEGEMNLSVFGGDMVFSQIATERLFGIAPVISGNVKFDKLNLEQITKTYDFGAISGLVSGNVNQLRITNWETERLDGYIESVKSKGVRQTISQRALNNISSIGGVQQAISKTFLRFFDEFKYKKLAIGCKLRNSVCEIKGLEESNGGYYLVKGKGLPNINIVGFRQFIDWETFIARLLNAEF